MSQLSPFLRCFREDWAIPYHRHFCGKYNWVIIIAYTFHFHFSLFFFIFKLITLFRWNFTAKFFSQYAGQINLTKMFYLGDFALLKVKRFLVDFLESGGEENLALAYKLWNSCRRGSDTGMSHQYNINWAWRQQQLTRVQNITKWQRGLFEEGQGGRGLCLGTPISLSSSTTSWWWSSSSSSWCQHLHHHHQFSFPRSLHKRGVQLLQNFEIRSQGAYSENNAENIQQKRDGWVNK